VGLLPTALLEGSCGSSVHRATHFGLTSETLCRNTAYVVISVRHFCDQHSLFSGGELISQTL
jgi:hypothetical protein